MSRKLMSILAGCLVAAVFPAGTAMAAPAGAGRPVTATGRDETGRLLQQLLDAEHAAGLPGAFAEVRDGNRRWELASGVADVATGRPVHPWFSQRVGSITKSFVATTVLQLVGEGRVRLDAPIGDWLPDVVTGDRARQVTVRMLLQHTSGIGNYTDMIDSYEALEQLRTTIYAPRQLAEAGLALPQLFPPGTAWSYSNTNYILAGLLIERVTGHRVADEVSRRILRPLGLRDTVFPGTDPVIRAPHALAYVPGPDGTLIDFSVMNMSWAWAAGELISTPQDLDTFYRALLAGRLLAPRLLAEMRDTVPVDPAFPDAAGYGLGLFRELSSCGPVWGHTGGVIGQATFSFNSPDGTRQVSLAENLTFADPQLAQAIAEARSRFLNAALCGPQTGTAAASSAGATGGARTHGAEAGREITPLAPLPAFG